MMRCEMVRFIEVAGAVVKRALVWGTAVDMVLVLA